MHIYELPSEITNVRAFVFFPKAEGDLIFSISDDGKTFLKIAAHKTDYFQGAGEYGYWKPVLFYADAIREGKFLKLELTSETQIGRLEISHKAPAP
jgi:hypothetical protein